MNERIRNPWASLILAQLSTSEFMRFFLEYIQMEGRRQDEEREEPGEQ